MLATVAPAPTAMPTGEQAASGAVRTSPSPMRNILAIAPVVATSEAISGHSISDSGSIGG